MGKIITGVLIFMIFSQISVLMHGAIPNPGYFSIDNFTYVISTPTITITSPNGGENLVGGTIHTIRWTSSQPFNSIDIEYYNGFQWYVIVNGTQDDGSFSWVVPNISTTNARLWIKGYSSSGNPTDYSDNTFTISKFSGSITVTSPNGGEVWVAGSKQNITWYSSGNVGNVKILYSTDGGYNWMTIITSTSNDGLHAWTLPSISSSNCLIKISDVSNSQISDISNSTFSISFPESIIITSPNGGEVWIAGSTENITWLSTGNSFNVIICYSTDGGSSWNIIATSTTNDGTYAWTLPNVSSSDCLIWILDALDGIISDMSDLTFSIVPIATQPEIHLNRSRLNFGAVTSGVSTTSQSFLISNSGGGTLNWVITDNVNWVNYSYDSGQNSEVITVTANPSGLSVGTHTAIIAVSDVNASNTPQLINVTLKVYNPSNNAVPFGSFATPEDGLTGVAGSIAVTGWVLDDIGVESVKIYRKVDGTISFIGDAVFVEGARPDVEQAYPDYPYNYRAGWGYMLLTNFLPDGQLVLKAIAKDIAGRQVELGTKTIIVDNAHAVKPFGAIDTPFQGGEASGSRYRNNGWALTPQPNKIPEDGSTIIVFIDGYLVGKAKYNLYRSDIATLFPGYANTNGSWGYFDFDTTAYSNGIHTIAWSVTDNAGNSDGIGSRYFTIQNTGGSAGGQAQSAERKAAVSRVPRSTFNVDLSQLPVNYSESIIIRKGYRRNSIPQTFYPDDNGMINTEINELDRVEVQLNAGSQWSSSNQSNAHYEGYLVIDNELRPLPIGSILEAQKGIFYWQPGPGFLGEYRFVFIKKDQYNHEKKDIKIKILPGYPGY